MDTPIPDKLYFKIGEVVSITGIKAHVLRYWEAEFGADFRPVKSRGRQRLYRRQEIELVLQLKDLLYRQGYTIAGAKNKLRSKACDQDSAKEPSGSEPVIHLLQELRSDLIRLRKTLDC
ncbi:MAG: MerR family transcriptional regulator [Desulfuromonadales bacterium C00003096]|jgi:DNA-binding transcriptional MerR regulator|nr:MAG: MerR family transcriptional regulator [Desulfuromonadales bacterium C00003096]